MSSASGTPKETITHKSGLSAAEILSMVAQGPSPWFPSQFSASAGIPRDSLDEPLNALRAAGLIRVLDWIRGVGQGYGITEIGLAVVKNPEKLTRVLAGVSETHPTGDPRLSSTTIRVTTPRPVESMTTFDRGELARKAPSDPAPAILAPILVLACVLWFLFGGFLTWKTDGSLVGFIKGTETISIMRTGGLSGMDLMRGEWWRLISASFVHIGAIHLLLNMYGLGAIGGLAESLWGRKRFVVIYLLSGFAGGCLAMISRPDSLVAGASAAFWGLMTSTAAWMILYRQHLPQPIVQDWAKLLIVVLSLNILISFAPGVSWEGHLGGGATGFICSITLNLIRQDNRRLQIAGISITALLSLGMAYALYASMMHSDKWNRLWTYLQGTREIGYIQTMGTLVITRAEAIYPEVALSTISGTRGDKVLARVNNLEDDAKKAVEKLHSPSWLEKIIFPVYWKGYRSHDSARVYAEAIVSYTEALKAALKGQDGDLSEALAKKKALLTYWQQLHSSP